MRFKIGMRVYIEGEKFIIKSIEKSRFHSIDETLLDISADHETEDGYSVLFLSDDDGIKPIITRK